MWVVGEDNFIFHYDGSDWVAVRTGAFATLNAVWGTDDGQVWIGSKWADDGEPVLRHFDGTTWRSVDVGTSLADAIETTITDIWGTGPANVWVACDVRTDAGRVTRLIHWDGRAWSVAISYAGPDYGVGRGDFMAVWGSGPSDVWLGGNDDASGSRLDHFDGRGWTRIELPLADRAPEPITDVWGTSANDVWTGDRNGSVFHFDGAQWQHVPRVTSYPTTVRGWSSDACHVFVSEVFLVEGTP